MMPQPKLAAAPVSPAAVGDSGGGQKWSAVTVLYAAFALTGFTTALLGPALPALSERLHISDSQAGRFFIAHFLGGFVAALASSATLRRFSARRTVIAAFIAISCGFAAAAFLEWPIILGAVALYGAGIGLAIPTITVIAASQPSLRRRTGSAAALNWINFVWGLGALAAPSAISLMLAQWSQPAVYAWIAAVAGLTAIALSTTIERERDASRRPSVVRRSVSPPNILLTALTSILLFLYVGSEASIAGWTPLWVARTGAPKTLIGIPASCFWGGILAARFMGPFILRYFGPSYAILAGIALSSVGLITAAFGSFVALVACGAIAGLGFGMIFPTAVSVFCDRAGSEASRTINFLFASAGLGGAVVPFCIGWIVSIGGGFRGGILAILCCTAAMALVEVAIASATTSYCRQVDAEVPRVLRSRN